MFLTRRRAPTNESVAPRVGLLPCPMGTAGREVCMQDPLHLAHWPDICRTCRERTGSRVARTPVAEPDQRRDRF